MRSEFVDPHRTDAPHWAERLVRFLDDGLVVPGTKRRIGFDALLGLLPGGDAVSAVGALSLFYLAIQRGVPRAVLARMAANVAVDALIGSIPLVGDLFDFGFKANRRNLQLIERVTVPIRRRENGGRSLGDYLAYGLVTLMIVGAITVPLLLAYALKVMIVGW